MKQDPKHVNMNFISKSHYLHRSFFHREAISKWGWMLSQPPLTHRSHVGLHQTIDANDICSQWLQFYKQSQPKHAPTHTHQSEKGSGGEISLSRWITPIVPSVSTRPHLHRGWASVCIREREIKRRITPNKEGIVERNVSRSLCTNMDEPHTKRSIQYCQNRHQFSMLHCNLQLTECFPSKYLLNFFFLCAGANSPCISYYLLVQRYLFCFRLYLESCDFQPLHIWATGGHGRVHESMAPELATS